MTQPRFTTLEQATAAELAEAESQLGESNRRLADRVLNYLATLAGEPTLGMPINTFQHCLQTATRVARDNASEEMIVCGLLHDAGESLAPHTHGEWSASLLRPFVSPTSAWILQHHPEFQGYYFWHKIGEDRDARDRYRAHPAFDACVDFCERWDQLSFDPAYRPLPLEAFEPAVRAVFSRTPACRTALLGETQ